MTALFIPRTKCFLTRKHPCLLPYQFLSNITMSCETKHLVFCYGTLKRNEPNHHLLQNSATGTVIYEGLAKTVQKFPLVIASKYNIPYILYKEGHGKQVMGELYRVDDEMLASLDELECHPKYYTRIQTNVELLQEDSSEKTSSPKAFEKPWIYFLMNFREELIDLPHLESYNSNGPHGLSYVERYKRKSDLYHFHDVKKI